MSPRLGLVLVNFFMADIAGGLGPFLATWLAGVAQWNPQEIGFIATAGQITMVALSGPAGALVDRAGRPRLMLWITCACILAGTMSLLVLRSFWPVVLSQVLASAGATLGGPALVALTLGVVGRRGFPRQEGRNMAANHAGNVMAAALVAGLSGWVGAGAPFGILAGMTVATVLSIALIRRSDIDDDRARGRNKASEDKEDEDAPSSLRALLRHRRLLMFAVAVGLFNLANDTILPLLGQRVAAAHHGNATTWMATWVLVAQLSMVPMSWLGGHFADRRGALWLMLAACITVSLRAAFAGFTADPYWVIGVEVLDGIGAGLVSVATPIAVTELTYGGGHTQAAIGGVTAVQAGAAALSAMAGGILAEHLGWEVAFFVLAVPALFAIPVLLGLIRQRARRRRSSSVVPKAAASSARV